MRKFDNLQDIENFIHALEQSPAFQILKDKTQVFNYRKSENVMSRGSHSEMVADYAENLARGVTKDEVEIKKAYLMGLLHDIGHIPYGHAGESSANKVVETAKFTDEEKRNYAEIRRTIFGKDYAEKNSEQCFEHNENSAMTFVAICQHLEYEPDPEIIAGILSHSTSRVHDTPPTIAQQAVRLADKVAYINFDIQDLFQSFEEKSLERAALDKLYDEPVKDIDGNIVYIQIGDERVNSAEFIRRFDAGDRATLFTNEAIRLANIDGKITGCNEIVIEIGDKKKLKKNLEKKQKDNISLTEEEKNILANVDKEIRELWIQMKKQSPIFYMAYQIKEKSDDFIRTAKGLEEKSQKERSTRGQSAVGNEDLLNEFTYRVIADFMEKELQYWAAHPEAKESRLASMPPQFRAFMSGYDAYLKEEKAGIQLATGKDLSMPQICTIVNYIGRHTNSQLDALKTELGITDRFKQDVVSKLEELNDSKYYDSDTHQLTKAGVEFRKKIYDTYGSLITIRFGLEEEDLSPLVPDEVIEEILNQGLYVFQEEDKKLSSEEKLQKFVTVATEEERQKYIEIVNKINSQLLASGVSR